MPKLVFNVLIALFTTACLVYVLQKTCPRFSIRALFVFVTGFALVFGLTARIASLVGYPWFDVISNCVYFSPILFAFLVRIVGGVNINWRQIFSYRKEQGQPDEFENADEALAMASKLDRVGKWDEALDLYRYARDKWPDSSAYIEACMDEIEKKKGL